MTLTDNGHSGSNRTNSRGNTPAPVDEFEHLTVKALDGTRKPVNSAPPKRIQSHIEKLQQAEAEAAYQANNQRDKFFRWALRNVTMVLGSTYVVFGVFMWSQWHHLSDWVIIAFFTATVAEVLGLAFIIATHLYPNGDRSGKRQEKDADHTPDRGPAKSSNNRRPSRRRSGANPNGHPKPKTTPPSKPA